MLTLANLASGVPGPGRPERGGMVSRTVHSTVPPRVDNALTPMGATLHSTIRALVGWTEEHRSAIAAARAVLPSRG